MKMDFKWQRGGLLPRTDRQRPYCREPNISRIQSRIKNKKFNVGIRFDPDKRNTVITLAEEKFGKSMMRTGVPILKLDNIILEFHRNL